MDPCGASGRPCVTCRDGSRNGSVLSGMQFRAQTARSAQADEGAYELGGQLVARRGGEGSMEGSFLVRPLHLGDIAAASCEPS